MNAEQRDAQLRCLSQSAFENLAAGGRVKVCATDTGRLHGPHTEDCDDLTFIHHACTGGDLGCICNGRLEVWV